MQELHFPAVRRLVKIKKGPQFLAGLTANDQRSLLAHDLDV